MRGGVVGRAPRDMNHPCGDPGAFSCGRTVAPWRVSTSNGDACPGADSGASDSGDVFIGVGDSAGLAVCCSVACRSSIIPEKLVSCRYIAAVPSVIEIGTLISFPFEGGISWVGGSTPQLILFLDVVWTGVVTFVLMATAPSNSVAHVRGWERAYHERPQQRD